MCGRYVRRSDKQRIAEHFRIDPTTLPDLDPSYNIAPQTFQPIAPEPKHGRPGNRDDALGPGALLHFWAKDAKKFRLRLVPADLFYEWHKIDAKTKQPFAIGLKDGSPYAFAGLWERWRDPAFSCTFS